jgi:photosystem II stability/assembly factor-like uncharacterized protein
VANLPVTAQADGIFDRLAWRCVGPFRGGRVVAVVGDPVDRRVFYFGSTGGGVWKSENYGAYWFNVSDGFFSRASVGSIDVAPSDPNRIYVGMGESCIRNNVSHGDGVYTSPDAGKTWRHLGLEATRNISRIRVHPTDADTVFVAALGHAHGPNPERGVYRTKDGGGTWELVLHRDANSGVADLSIDPTDPSIIYASVWQAIRRPHDIVSGGPGSGIFRSNDGGDSWVELTRNPGLPTGLLGRIGIAASGGQAGRVFAVIEAEDGAIFRSEDHGETWSRQSEKKGLRDRPWYYSHIHAHPTDPEQAWVLSKEAWLSTDGAATFRSIPFPHGDHHDLWIDPNDPERMIEGNDGGATVSLDGGRTWSTIMNQPTAEMYHVAVDTHYPYRIYGAQQDNTTISVPSRSAMAGISQVESFAVGGGESGQVAVRPDDPDVVFAGSRHGTVTRFDSRTGQIRNVSPWPLANRGDRAADLRYRFNWTSPLSISPHDPGTLYLGGSHVFRSTDDGDSWQVISPDLSRDDKERQKDSGGPITNDNSGADQYCTVFAFAESPVTPGLLWAGTDDGLVHVSRDNGSTWSDVTPDEIGEYALISAVEPSQHDAATAWVVATRHKQDDFRPYILRTTDHGATWTLVTDGIPADDIARVVREDPQRAGLLFAGTETGVLVSYDGGDRWQRLSGTLPVVPIHDLLIKDDDLVVATHGRSFWVLDDITALRAYDANRDAAEPYLLAPRPTVRFRADGHRQHGRPTEGVNYARTGATLVTYRVTRDEDGDHLVGLDAGENPPSGVLVPFWLPENEPSEVQLTFLDAEGQKIRSFKRSKPRPDGDGDAHGHGHGGGGTRLTTEPGLNRFVWDMRYPGARALPDADDVNMSGPMAVPGTYTVRLEADGRSWDASFQILADPRLAVAPADLDAQFALYLRIRDQLTKTHGAIVDIRALKARLDPAHPAVAQLTALEGELTQLKAKSHSDYRSFPPMLNHRLTDLAKVVAEGDYAPTKSMEAAFSLLTEQFARIEADVEVIAASVPAAEEPAAAAGSHHHHE